MRMATDLEKRLRLLRQQVYGKEIVSRGETAKSTSDHTDIIYLYQDLTKIGLLATLAIGIQIILFILTKNHILNLNFF